jgi:hypothetical protein
MMRARGMLQTHICEYNQANFFLAEVIKTTVTKEHKTFPVLYNFIKTNLSEVKSDAHTLFYAVKRDMLKAQKGYTTRIPSHINELTIKVEDKKPLYRQFVHRLHSLSVAYRQFGGTISNEEILDKFKQKCRSLLDQYPSLHDDVSLYTLFKSKNFNNTWDKHLTFYETRSRLCN